MRGICETHIENGQLLLAYELVDVSSTLPVVLSIAPRCIYSVTSVHKVANVCLLVVKRALEALQCVVAQLRQEADDTYQMFKRVREEGPAADRERRISTRRQEILIESEPSRTRCPRS
jgi:hypothetical protein